MDAITGQAVLAVVVAPKIPIHIELLQTSFRAQVHPAQVVLGNRPNCVADQALFARVVDELRLLILWVFRHGNAVIPQANPQPAAAVNKQCARVDRRKPISGFETLDLAFPQAAQAQAAAKPQIANFVGNDLRCASGEHRIYRDGGLTRSCVSTSNTYICAINVVTGNNPQNAAADVVVMNAFIQIRFAKEDPQRNSLQILQLDYRLTDFCSRAAITPNPFAVFGSND